MCNMFSFSGAQTQETDFCSFIFIQDRPLTTDEENVNGRKFLETEMYIRNEQRLERIDWTGLHRWTGLRKEGRKEAQEINKISSEFRLSFFLRSKRRRRKEKFLCKIFQRASLAEPASKRTEPNRTRSRNEVG